MTTRYRELTVSGSPREMGEQIGEGLREEIRNFDAIAMDRTRKAISISDEAALAVAADSMGRVQIYAPHLLEELEGMSRASGVSGERLMLLQIRNQLQTEDGGRGVAPGSSVTTDAGCTSFAVSGQVSSLGAVAGQNWDNDVELDPHTVVLTRRPDDAPAFATITQAGLIAYIGVSDAGIGVCLNTLPAPARALGVPHYFTVRAIFESRSLEAAAAAVSRAERAIPANVLLATPQGPADFEVTIDAVHVLRDDDEDGVVTHTNHCLHPELVTVNDSFPELIESIPRKCRIDELLAAAPRPIQRSHFESALSDHDNHPRSICRHPNDHPVTGFWSSVFSILIEADNGRMHISRGNPCENAYETYELN
ncbi:MAG: peptidase C45 [Gemmatimonadetes bacterium]|jgi:isopenicillin-N N-acyltransferase-like protein|nr:peptidase C45 [Gemmatimonadota bacterium]MBT5142284.1 peptidase C45 [Gemmatimonadota bacterium]MBT5589131.1 peptidase C45 [Gemmatimonadota bacterium]MBT5963219.1 peptidase C45 [Gemmatimonadota bacterium]MBT6626155.1 peptidase C45 [Gemmatimonadota bacterium]